MTGENVYGKIKQSPAGNDVVSVYYSRSIDGKFFGSMYSFAE